MTSTVTRLTHYVDKALILRLFARFKGRYGNLWTSRATHEHEWEVVINDWLEELSKFTLVQVRNAVNKTLSTFKDFPPTLGQLIDLCLKESGTPELQDVIRMMVARDFSHPLVKMVYDKIGSWTLKNGKEEEISRKTKEHYSNCLAEFYQKPKESWAKLEAFKSQSKEILSIKKIPNIEERKGFKERLVEYQKTLESLKLSCKGQSYREFDENKIKNGHRDFDHKLYNDYRDYLLSIPEEKVLILPAKYLYDRNRFVGQREQREFLRKQGFNNNPQVNNESVSKRNYEPNSAYKTWISD